MRITGEIIAFNKRINAAIADGRIEDASKWMLRLQKYIKRAAVLLVLLSRRSLIKNINISA